MPSIDVKENWSAERQSLRSPWTAYREFTVTGTTSSAAALTATGIPQEGQGHPYNLTRLLCDGPEVRDKRGVDYWVIGCPYSFSQTGDPTPTEQDPLNEPAVVRWEHIEVLEPVDHDLADHPRPILTTAGFPLETPVARPIVYKKFTIFKNFPYYDLNLSKAYDNSVNDDDIPLGLGINAAAHHLRCVSIIPAAEYKATAAFVPMAFTFELISQGTLGLYPFQHRILDQGLVGWYAPTKFAKFTVDDGTGTRVAASSPIRLDGTGKPLSIMGDVKVGENNSAIANPKPIRKFATETTADASGNTDAVWLFFQKTRIVSMSDLTALL